MDAALDLMRTLVRGMTVESMMANELAEIAYSLECQGRAFEAAGLRAIVRHHRAKVVQMQGQLAGLEMLHGSSDPSDPELGL